MAGGGGIATVIFCRPPGSSETVCHNITCGKPPPLLPRLFNSSLPSCGLNTTMPPTSDNMTTATDMTTAMTTAMSSTTVPPLPDRPIITWIIVLCTILVLLIALLILFIRKKRSSKHFKRPADDESMSGSEEGLPDEQRNAQQVELQVPSSDAETVHHVYEEISNATPVEAEAKLHPVSAGSASKMKRNNYDEHPV